MKYRFLIVLACLLLCFFVSMSVQAGELKTVSGLYSSEVITAKNLQKGESKHHIGMVRITINGHVEYNDGENVEQDGEEHVEPAELEEGKSVDNNTNIDNMDNSEMAQCVAINQEAQKLGAKVKIEKTYDVDTNDCKRIRRVPSATMSDSAECAGSLNLEF